MYGSKSIPRPHLQYDVDGDGTISEMELCELMKNGGQNPRNYPCVRSIPVKKKLFYFLVWTLNWNWNWNWDGSWNDLRKFQKLWEGLCILYFS